MPITNVGSWLPTIDEFLQHWTDVNTALSPNSLVLNGPYPRGTLATNRTAVATAITDVQAKDNTTQAARGDRDLLRASLRPRFLQFRAAVNGLLPNSRYVPALPKTPGFNDAPGKWLDAGDDMSSLWAVINANSPPIPGFLPPLTFGGGYAVATFDADLADIKAAFTALANADQAAQLSREQRDQTFAPVYQRLKQYRQAVVATFPADSALVQSLPKLTPAPGHTPKPVNVSAAWDMVLNKARITYTASDDASLDHYELRGCFGTKYKTDEEQVLASNPPGVLEFLNDDGLVAPGSRVFYKVYVVVDMGNEKGSKSVSVTRP